MKSDQILRLLAKRHRADVCVPQCKTGESPCPVIDFWVLRGAWDLTTIAYEVKASRSDFLRDKKWSSYLPFCNELYFATPKGVVRPSEIPEDVGHVLVLRSGCRVLKPARRRVVADSDLFRVAAYVLRNRTVLKESELALVRTGISERQVDRASWREAKKKVDEAGLMGKRRA